MLPTKEKKLNRDTYDGYAQTKLYWLYVVENWKILAICFAVCIIGAVLYIGISMPQYRVTSSIMVKDEHKGGDVSSVISVFEDINPLQNITIDNEVDVIRSVSLLKEVINRTQINKQIIGKRFLSKVDLYGCSPITLNDSFFNYKTQEFAYKIGIEVDKEDGFRVLANANNEIIVDSSYVQFPIDIITPDGVITLSCNDSAKLFEYSEYEIKVFPATNLASIYKDDYLEVSPSSKTSSILVLSLKTTNKERGVLFLNTLISCYNQSALDEKNEVSKSTEDFINQRIEMLSKELGTTEKDLEKYKKREGLTDVSSNAEVYVSQNAEYERKRAENETQLNLVKYLRNYLSDDSKKGTIIPSNFGLTDAGLVTLIDQYNEIVMSLNRFKMTTADDNPVVMLKKSQMESLYTNVRLLLENVENGLIIAQKDLDKQNEKFKSLIYNIPTQERMFVEIERQRTIQQQLFVLLLQKREENALAMAATVNKAKVVEECVSSLRPVTPKKSLVAVVSLMIAFFVAFAILIVKRIKKKTVSSMKEFEIEEISAFPVFSVVPEAEDDNTSLNESFRRMRTNLLTETQQVFVVASQMKGEGKTFVATQLAMSIASMGRTVVLMNFTRQQKGSECEKFDVLNRMEVEQTETQNMYHLQVNLGLSMSLDLLSSQEFEDYLASLKCRYGYVVIDTESMNESSDAYVLNRIADQTLYVFRLGYTDRNVFRSLEDSYENEELRNLLLVVNASKSEI